MQEFVGIAGLIGTLVLVAITGWYAWQTQQMVREMSAARRASVRPDVRLDVEIMGAAVMTRVENVGIGPAIDIFATITTESQGPDISQVTQWHTPVLRPGESRLLDFPHQADGHNLFSYNELHERDFRILLSGHCTDLTGESQPLSSVLKFDPTTRRNFEVVMTAPDEELARHAKEIASELGSLRRVVERLAAKR